MVFSQEVKEAVMSLKAPPRMSKKERSRAKRLLKEDTDVREASQVNKPRRQKAHRERRSHLSDEQLVAKSAVYRHSRTLHKLLQGSQWAARDAGMVKVVERLIKEISTLKATYEKQGKTVRIRKSDKKTIERSAVMNLNPRHHTRRIHITKEQRAINKAKDGIASTLPEVSKATHFLPVPVELPSNVVSIAGGSCGREVRTSLAVPVRNATPRTRNERMKFLGPYLMGLRKKKYSPYSRPKEVLSQAA